MIPGVSATSCARAAPATPGTSKNARTGTDNIRNRIAGLPLGYHPPIHPGGQGGKIHAIGRPKASRGIDGGLAIADSEDRSTDRVGARDAETVEETAREGVQARNMERSAAGGTDGGSGGRGERRRSGNRAEGLKISFTH